MKCVLALCILLVSVYSLEGKPEFRQHSKPYGIGHPFIPNCDQQFQCGSGHFMGHPECVPTSAVCNGFPDCSNGADENGCANPNCWSRGMIQCSDGKTCAKWCDGFPQCPNLEDEIACPTTCPKGNLLCNDDKTCIKLDKICDGHEDCPSGEDEDTCRKGCEDHVLCSDVCDGNKQCSDGEDENNCLTDETYRVKFEQQYICFCIAELCDEAPSGSCLEFCRDVTEQAYQILATAC